MGGTAKQIWYYKKKHINILSKVRFCVLNYLQINTKHRTACINPSVTVYILWLLLSIWQVWTENDNKNEKGKNIL